MGFFDEINAAAEAVNAELDQKYVAAQAEAATKEKVANESKKIERRQWAVGVLEAGNMPIQNSEKICSAMKIVATDPEIPRKEVERLLLKHGQYRRFIFIGVVRDFLKLGGDPTGPLGFCCIKWALDIPEGANLFDGDDAEDMLLGLEILGRFDVEKRPEIARVYDTLRKKFPFATVDKRQNMPHSIGAKLYPKLYDGGRCTYLFKGEPKSSRVQTY